MILTLATCEVRSFRASDAQSLALHADNRRIWINLRDRFPFPYTKRDAQTYIKACRERRIETSFAIAVDGAAVGGVSFVLQQDVDRMSAEIGYWLGEPLWGRGIMTDALRAVTTYAIANHGLTRVFAMPFAHNVASCRVLEKAGYVLEGRLRRAAIKDGQIVDMMQYAFIAPE